MKIFNESARELHNKTMETFLRIEKVQRKFLVFSNGNNENPDLNLLIPILDGKSFDFLPGIRIREAASDVLLKYSSMLYAVSSGSLECEIDEAIEKFAGSLEHMSEIAESGQYGRGRTGGLLKRTIDLTNDEISENRLSALKGIMDNSQVDLGRLVALIVEQNDEFRERISKITAHIIKEMNRRRPLLDDHISPTLAEYDNEMVCLVQESEEIQKALGELDKAFNTIPEAHFAVRNILGKKIVRLKDLQNLVRRTQNIKRLYRSLP